MFDRVSIKMLNILYDPIYSALWGNSNYNDGSGDTVEAHFIYQYAETLNLDDKIYVYEDLNYFYQKFKFFVDSLSKNIIVYYEIPMFIQ